MKTGTAMLAGAIGALLMTVVMAIARAAGMDIHLEQILGSMVARSLGVKTFFVGLAMHLVVGALFGVIYEQLFIRVTHHASYKDGLTIGIIHGVIAGTLLAFLPDLHPAMPEAIPDPGPFFAGDSAYTAVLFVAMHALYGAVVGAIYQPVPIRTHPVGGEHEAGAH